MAAAKNGVNSRSAKAESTASGSLFGQLTSKVVGQDDALAAIVPYVQMFHAGLAPEGRPAGVFFLLGPTGTGKTRTVEALAEVLHGNARNLVRIDCGEYQLDHEVAKLIGAPPGYLGHRETQPLLTQARVNASASEHSGLSLVLFDEIEKAAPSLTRLLLGVLDKAALRLGDNTTVSFERSLVFLTSNLGARGMAAMLRPSFGLGGTRPQRGEAGRKLEKIARSAARRHFPPEFMNRVDAVLTYRPLAGDALDSILDHQIAELQRLISSRLGSRAFQIEVTEGARRFLIREGVSEEYGARELKRAMHRWAIQPLAALVAEEAIEPGCRVRLEAAASGDGVCWTAGKPKPGEAAAATAA